MKQKKIKIQTARQIPIICNPIFDGVKRTKASSPDPIRIDISKYSPVSFKSFICDL